MQIHFDVLLNQQIQAKANNLPSFKVHTNEFASNRSASVDAT
jgi:hypothetical protein